LSDENSVFDRWRARGEAVFNQVSEELMKNPNFVKAMQAAMKGKERVDVAAGQALKAMNVPTRSEFRRALSRIEALEQELAALKAEREAPVRERRTKPRLRPRGKGPARRASG
jgi:polyhydroxyalkanoate synthesis regulator phasin